MNGLAIAVAVASALGSLYAGAFASAGRARALLGGRAARFESLGPETLEQAVRAACWGFPGIAFAMFVGVLYGVMFRVAPQFRGRIGLGLLVAAVLGIGISQVQRLLMRIGIERYLERRLNP